MVSRHNNYGSPQPTAKAKASPPNKATPPAMGEKPTAAKAMPKTAGKPPVTPKGAAKKVAF